jgi:hypothetical protein
MNEQKASNWLVDRRNIVHGLGRVIYAQCGVGRFAWHLPGMRTTTDEAEALRVAIELDRLIRANSPQAQQPVLRGRP